MNQKTVEITEAYIPGISNKTGVFASMRKLSLKELMEKPMVKITSNQLEEMIRKLNELELELASAGK